MKRQLQRRETLTASAFLSPSFILLVVFTIIPIIEALFLSFTEYRVLNSPTWIGWKNYSHLMADTTVRAAMRNTIVFVASTVPAQTILALVIAALIAGLFRNRFGNFIRAALFIPTIASPATIGAVWCMLCGAKGPINLVLMKLGAGAVNWLGSKSLAMVLICFVTVWRNVGYFLVIFYAGIMDIPKELYEAAQIDGASPLQQFFRITLPNLKSISYLVIILGTIWAFQEFDLVEIMTNGGPGVSTMMWVITVYRAAFKESRMGYASAISVVLLICILIVSILQRMVLRGDGGEE